jgi:hypothetical protein
MTITVTLDAAGEVQLDPTEKTKKRNGRTRHLVNWKRGDDQDFVFVGVNIEAPEGVFGRPVIKNKTIKVTNYIRKDSGTVDYPYRVHVRTPDGRVHSSGGEAPELESGRGVIRNQP